MPKLIRSKIFPGNAQHFRAMMQQLGNRHSWRWQSLDDKCLHFREERQTKRELVAVTEEPPRAVGRYVTDGGAQSHYREIDVTPPQRSSWQITLEPMEEEARARFAVIEAYEQPSGSTRVDFFDGYCCLIPGLERDPIGPVFEEFCEWVTSRLHTEKDNLSPAGFIPKTPRGFRRWKTAWGIIKAEQENSEKFDEEPTNADLAEAIGEQMPEAWGPAGPSERTVRRIKRAGEG